MAEESSNTSGGCAGALCRKAAWGGFIVLLVFVLDQATKYFINFCHLPKKAALLNADPYACGWSHLTDWIVNPDMAKAAPTGFGIEILPFFNLVMVWNHGITFGLFNQGNPWPLILFSCVVVIILLVWFVRTPRTKTALMIGLPLVIGGAIGNIVDRIRLGAVVDFLDFHYEGWHYPAFNIADCAIVIGIAILLFDSLILEQRNDKTQEAEKNET